MTDVLLDTSAYSALARGHTALATWSRRAHRIVLTPVVLGELHAGFRKGNRRDPNVRELERFLESRRVAIVPIDEETAERYGYLFDQLRRAGRPKPINDIWIAASALQHGLTLLTTDEDFEDIPGIMVHYFAQE